MSADARLNLHHVRVEVGRTPHGLTGVVDDEVEAAARRQQLMAERLDARRVSQIESEDLEAIAPLLEVWLPRVAGRRVARKARGHDQVRAAAQQLQARLVANLDASAGQQRDAPAEIRQLGALAEVQLRARGTELIVEVMNLRVLLLADIAMLQFLRIGVWDLGFGIFQKIIRRCEDRLAPQRADAGLLKDRVVAPDTRRLSPLVDDLRHPAAFDSIRVVHVGDGLQKPFAILRRHVLEQAAIHGNPLE